MISWLLDIPDLIVVVDDRRAHRVSMALGAISLFLRRVLPHEALHSTAIQNYDSIPMKYRGIETERRNQGASKAQGRFFDTILHTAAQNEHSFSLNRPSSTPRRP